MLLILKNIQNPNLEQQDYKQNYFQLSNDANKIVKTKNKPIILLNDIINMIHFWKGGRKEWRVATTAETRKSTFLLDKKENKNINVFLKKKEKRNLNSELLRKFNTPMKRMNKKRY